MKSEFKVQQGKQDRISNDKLGYICSQGCRIW